jgi:transposase
MVDISDGARRVRGELQSAVVRRRRWTAEEKGRVVAEAVTPGAVIAEVAQHLFNWIRAAKDGHLALPADESLGFVPAVACNPHETRKASRSGRVEPIEVMLDGVVVRIPAGADRRVVEVVLRTLRRA